MVTTATAIEPQGGAAAGVDRTGSPRQPAAWSLFLTYQTAFWAFFFAVNMLLASVFAEDDPPWFVLVEVVLCFVATSAIRSLSLREPLFRRVGLSQIGVIAGGSILATTMITLALFFVGRAWDFPRPSRSELVARATITLMMLTIWCAIYVCSRLIFERNTTEVRALRAESLALRKELERLQGQISPHFLFNALNTMMACRDDPAAVEMLTLSLSSYLRFLLRPSATLEPLAREIDALEEYLTIQGMRFSGRLETRIDCDMEARSVEVPPVLVQPLVENAIKYGSQTAEPPVRVSVAARREENWLSVEVTNSGSWVAPGGEQSPGTGLLSLEHRLRLLVGPAATVSHREAGGQVTVTVRLPVSSRGALSTTEPSA